jgi:hypothetical protein
MQAQYHRIEYENLIPMVMKGAGTLIYTIGIGYIYRAQENLIFRKYAAQALVLS